MNLFQGLIAAGVCIKTLFLEAQVPVTFPSETKESEKIRYEENVQIFAGRLKERLLIRQSWVQPNITR